MSVETFTIDLVSNWSYSGEMSRVKQPQQTLWAGIVVEGVKSLWEPWMIETDKLLDDEELIDL